MFKKLLSFLVVLLVLSLPYGAGAATKSEFQYSPENEGAIRLVASNVKSQDGANKFYAGLHIKFKEHWKTYWKHPGDTGMPIIVNSERSKNIKDLKVLYPYPKRFEYYGIETWGYTDEVVIPLEYEVVDENAPTYLGIDSKWAVCDEICIFVDNSFSLLLKPNETDESSFKLVSEYLKKVPRNINDVDNIAVSGFSVNDEVVSFTFESTGKPFGKDIDLFIFEKSDNFRFPQPEVRLSQDGMQAEITTKYEKLLKGETLYKKNIEVVLANGENSVESNFDIKNLVKTIDDQTLDKWKTEKADMTDMAEEQPMLNSAEGAIKPEDILLISLLFAFIGGLILNIMPCVLPVLSIKIMSIIKHGDSEKHFVRKSFLATILGILFSFMVLAGLVILLKSFGNAVSWGMQFQQPEFIIFLTFVLTLFACNQFGFFEFSLPSFLGGKIDNKIDKAGGSTSVMGNFLTGAFATLMATPCTAPFLSTAIAFALGVGAKYIILVFLFMGLGLAFPYILILIFPAIVKVFPKPGAWMKKVRVILGILLISTVFWLLYVMVSDIGMFSTVLLFACLAIMFIFLRVAKRMGLEGKRVFLSIIYIGVVALVIPRYFANVEMESHSMDDIWIAYEEGVIEQNVDEGKTVFVDVTADWCLTCKFNKARIINPMRDFYIDNDVVMIKADFTKPSRPIQKFLQHHNAYAIPLNIVYGPKNREGIKLPSLLTEKAVKEAIISVK